VLLGYAKSSTGVRQSRTGRFCAFVFFEILGERVFPQPRQHAGPASRVKTRMLTHGGSVSSFGYS
jgi:hypothetical protein